MANRVITLTAKSLQTAGICRAPGQKTLLVKYLREKLLDLDINYWHRIV